MSLAPPAENEARSDAAPLASVLQLLVDSGFIGAGELGNLAQLCSKMNRASLEDSIWASLCQSEYPASSNFNRNFLGERGYRWLYKRWSAPTFKRRRRPLPPLEDPPSCTAEQIAFCIHIRYDGNPVYSLTINGGTLSNFLEKGGVGYTFREPFVVGKAKWNYTEREELEYESQEKDAKRGLPVKCDVFNESRVDATIHLVRGPSGGSDVSMIRVFDSNDFDRPFVRRSPLVHPRLHQGETLTQDAKFGATKHEESGVLGFALPEDTTFRAWPLRHSNVAAHIQERIVHPLFFNLNLCLGAIEGGHFAIIGFEMYVAKDSGIESNPRYSKFDSLEEKDKHGVTLLHILSELQENM